MAKKETSHVWDIEGHQRDAIKKIQTLGNYRKIISFLHQIAEIKIGRLNLEGVKRKLSCMGFKWFLNQSLSEIEPLKGLFAVFFFRCDTDIVVRLIGKSVPGKINLI